MPRILVKGHFKNHGSPDGDTIRFKDTATKTECRVRLEAIDALETHYQPRGKRLRAHQPLAESTAAGTALREFLGFKNGSDDARGYIVRRPGQDAKGRIVAFAFAGTTTTRDGSAITTLDRTRLNDSANFHMLKNGHAYPCFYSQLEEAIRTILATTAKKARLRQRGVWSSDVTSAGVTYAPLAAACQAIVWPKLFRRLVDFYAYNPAIASPTETELGVFLGSRDYDKIWTLPGMLRSHLAKEIDITPRVLRLKRDPEDIVLFEQPA